MIIEMKLKWNFFHGHVADLTFYFWAPNTWRLLQQKLRPKQVSVLLVKGRRGAVTLKTQLRRIPIEPAILDIS